MKLTHRELRDRFKKFWLEHDHKEVPPIPLVPQNDPTTLFTGSGMQQFVPNLLGEPHPLGTRLFDIQPSFRAMDIEEVGDNRHTTTFEMMGNWSLGDYFKKEQLPWFFEFLVERLGFDPKNLYVTVFKGEGPIPADEESIEIWREIYKKYGIDAKLNERIFPYGAGKNWWSRAGTPEQMPPGEPGGPDSEVFYEFTMVEHDPAFGESCHPNCDCGRFLEIGNNVFMQYLKQDDGTFTDLPKKNVDFGGGYERLLAAANDTPDIFKTDLYWPTIETVARLTGKSYDENTAPMRIIADHLKGALFIALNGVLPSNKERGYILRRLIRRSAVKLQQLNGAIHPEMIAEIVKSWIHTYDGVNGLDAGRDEKMVLPVILDEINRFTKSLDRGLKEIQKIAEIDGKKAFDLYQSYGFPLEITEELFREKGQEIDKKQFYTEFEKHKNLSRTSSAGMFKGGLADHSDQVLKYHTATHLLHQALFDVLGDDVRQEGSNITGERLRFDFSSAKKPETEELKKIEDIINDKIKAELPMRFKIMPKNEAEKVGAKSFFKEKYPDMVKVYYIGGKDDHPETAYSKEFCGGPHVTNTKDIGHIEVYKFEKIGSTMYRVYAK